MPRRTDQVRSSLGLFGRFPALTQLAPDQKQAKFELGVSLILSSWHALTLAVQNGWGGPDSEDKRAWFAGAVSEFVVGGKGVEAEDVEDLLLQVMSDEFETTLEDGSEMEVATAVIKIRDEVSVGEFSTVDRMWETFKTKKSQTLKAVKVEQDSESEDSVDLEGDDEAEAEAEAEADVDMEDAPEPPTLKIKHVPEVDEEGFTKVVGRRR
jgi:pre-rRNA-processing protein TSR2